MSVKYWIRGDSTGSILHIGMGSKYNFLFCIFRYSTIYKKNPFGYGSSSVPVIMDDLQCRGEETDIAASSS
jgi:hypothetical protein